MKVGLDNFCDSLIQGIMKWIKVKGIFCIVYEFVLLEDYFFNSFVLCDLVEFKDCVDLIIVNCIMLDLEDVCDKVYICDLFGID